MSKKTKQIRIADMDGNVRYIFDPEHYQVLEDGKGVIHKNAMFVMAPEPENQIIVRKAICISTGEVLTESQYYDTDPNDVRFETVRTIDLPDGWEDGLIT